MSVKKKITNRIKILTTHLLILIFFVNGNKNGIYKLIYIFAKDIFLEVFFFLKKVEIIILYGHSTSYDTDDPKISLFSTVFRYLEFDFTRKFILESTEKVRKCCIVEKQQIQSALT